MKGFARPLSASLTQPRLTAEQIQAELIRAGVTITPTPGAFTLSHGCVQVRVTDLADLDGRNLRGLCRGY